MVALTFELYGSGQYSIRGLCEKLADEGLVNRLGRYLALWNTTDMLRNPFYAGIIRLPSTGRRSLAPIGRS